MNCEQAHARLADYSAGLLEGRTRQRLEAHLAECAACRGTLERFGRLDGLVRADALRPDQALMRSVMAGVSAQRRAAMPGWVGALDDVGLLALVVLAVPAILLFALREAGALAPLRAGHGLGAQPATAALVVVGLGLVAGLLSWVANRVSEALA